MVLRQCFEALRENQAQGVSKVLLLVLLSLRLFTDGRSVLCVDGSLS